jgi:hypothetical protein
MKMSKTLTNAKRSDAIGKTIQSKAREKEKEKAREKEKEKAREKAQMRSCRPATSLPWYAHCARTDRRPTPCLLKGRLWAHT